MSNGYATEDLEAILESLEADEADESDELAEQRTRSRPWSRPSTATGRGLVPPRPQTGYVTETRLQAALARVGEQIKTNSEAIKKVNSKLGTIDTEQTRQNTALKKETEERKKDTARLANQAQLLALLPLLQTPKTIQLTSEAGNLPVGTKVVVDGGGDSLSTLLPLLLVGGLGTGTGSGSGGGGTDMGGLGGLDPLLLVLLLTRR